MASHFDTFDSSEPSLAARLFKEFDLYFYFLILPQAKYRSSKIARIDAAKSIMQMLESSLDTSSEKETNNEHQQRTSKFASTKVTCTFNLVLKLVELRHCWHDFPSSNDDWSEPIHQEKAQAI